VVGQLAELSSDELGDSQLVAEILGLPGSFSDSESGVEPRGYRLLYRLPRFSDTIIERIVERFVNLQQIMRASLADLEQVEGVGEARAHSVKNGLARLAEASIFERYQ
jgi:diadenylate cyclase